MKKNLKKWMTLITAAALSLSLAACAAPGQSAASPSDTGGASAVSPQEPASAVGTVLLSVNPEIEMDYDDQGTVVALAGRNQEAQALLSDYTGYEGRPCTEVVGELVDEINARGYFDDTIDGHEKNIVLKLERGSQYPSEQFLNELAEAVRVVVEAGHIGSKPVTVDQDDYDETYDDRGYINASAAENILSQQFGRNDLEFVEKDYDLDDGDYEVEFILDGMAYEYEVDAFTGKVKEVEVEDDRYDDDWDDRYDDGDDDDWYGDSTGSDYPGDNDDWDDDWDDRYDDDDDWDDDGDDDDWYGDPTGSDYPGDSDDWDDDWDDRYDDDDDDDNDDGDD